MNLPPYLKANADGISLSVKVQPRAAKNEIGDAAGNELKVKVTAPPVDAAANEALVRLLADVLGCPRSAVQLVRGATSRHKQIWVRGVTAVDAAAKLAGAR